MTRPTRSAALVPVVLFLGVLAPWCLSAQAAADPAPPFGWIDAEGHRFVGEDGEPVTLHGCNVGNWLLLEMWMLRIDHGQFPDQYAFEQNLVDRFGESERHRLMELYRENYIKPRDFELIRSFGFNTIRLPINHRLIEDDDAPMTLKPGAFKWIDRAIAMAKDAGLYVILDLHGVPGGQSIDHPTGRVGQNRLWTDPSARDRTVWVWRQLAARYADEPWVAGYDLINEPYGDFGSDVRPVLGPLMKRLHDAVREVDPRHIVFFPSPIWGGHEFYGDPAAQGMTRVAFTEHHYPGLFGDEPSLRRHARFFREELPAKQRYVQTLGVPMFIGEWNPVFERLGGGHLMRQYFDRYAEYGWAATMWSAKILEPGGGSITDNWHLYTNAEPRPEIDFETASVAEIEAWFRWLGEMEYAVDEPMRAALTRPDPLRVPMPTPEPTLTEPPANDPVPGFRGADVGGALAGGQRVHGPGVIEVFGGGSDIWAGRDEFRLLYREVTGDFTLTAKLHRLGATHVYAKAGLMARSSLEPDAAHLLLHGFPGQSIAVGSRPEAAEATVQTAIMDGQWPVWLRLTRRGGELHTAVSDDGKNWRTIDPPAQPALGETCLVGLAVLSHQSEGLTAAAFSNVTLETDAGVFPPAADAADAAGIDADALFAPRVERVGLGAGSFEPVDEARRLWTLRGADVLAGGPLAGSGVSAAAASPGGEGPAVIAQPLRDAPRDQPMSFTVRTRALPESELAQLAAGRVGELELRLEARWRDRWLTIATTTYPIGADGSDHWQTRALTAMGMPDAELRVTALLHRGGPGSPRLLLDDAEVTVER